MTSTFAREYDWLGGVSKRPRSGDEHGVTRALRSAALALAVLSTTESARSQDVARAQDLLASSRFECFRLLGVSDDGGGSAVLAKVWEESPIDGAVALDPSPTTTVRVGSRFEDGEIIGIDVVARSVTARVRTTDPRRIKPWEEVVLLLPRRSRAQLAPPPLSVVLRPGTAGRSIEGTTWPACRVACFQGERLLVVVMSDRDGRFRLPVGPATGEGPLRVVAQAASGQAEWLSHRDESTQP